MAETRKERPWALNDISPFCWKIEPCTAMAVHDLQKSMKAKVAPVSKDRIVSGSATMPGSKNVSTLLNDASDFNLFKFIFLRL
jgi:hypothetical protein